MTRVVAVPSNTISHRGKDKIRWQVRAHIHKVNWLLDVLGHLGIHSAKDPFQYQVEKYVYRMSNWGKFG